MGTTRIVKTLDGVSVAAMGTVESAPVDVNGQGRVRPIIAASGADITVKLQTSVAGVWHDLITYPVAKVSVQDIVDLPGVTVRAVATNGNALMAQSVTVALMVEGPAVVHHRGA